MKDKLHGFIKSISEAEKLKLSSLEIIIGPIGSVFEVKLHGLLKFIEYIEIEHNLWSSVNIEVYEEKNIIRIVSNISEILNSLDLMFKQIYNYSSFDSFWDKKIAPRLSDIISYNHPGMVFLRNILIEKPSQFSGAYAYLTGRLQGTVNSSEYFNGLLRGFFFLHRWADLQKDNIQVEVDFLVNNQRKIDELILRYDSIEQEFRDKHSTVISIHQQSHEEQISSEITLYEQNKLRLAELEKTYAELIKLKKPAEHWAERAAKLKNEGWKAMRWMIALVGFGVVSVFTLLWLNPEGVLLNFIDNKASAIKWSIIFIVFVSFLAYGIRILQKVAFSAFHLARDAEEREQLAYVYLSLLNESAVDEKDRSLVLQAIFARADTGLLKDDASPTMPGGVVDKIFQK